MLTRRQVQTPISDALAVPGLTWSLLRHLSRPLGLPEARATLQRRFERRGSDFLALARRGIYANPGSPYHVLLGLAGCEYGDLERLVDGEGLDGALQTLFNAGVYLTVDEFKGRKPAVRGSAAVSIVPEQLHNPASAVHVLMQSSGSSGPRRTMSFDLAYLRDIAVCGMLYKAARGGSNWVHAIWQVPGGAALYYLLAYAAMGVFPARWFSQVDPAAPGLHPRYVWSGRLLRLCGALVGHRLPRPEHVPVDASLPIARWLAECLRAGRTPHLDAYSSSAAKLCRAAAEAGIDLAGAQIEVAGEPLTDALLATIRASGADAVGLYGSMEAGPVGYGCLRPAAADDVHVLTDLNALIQAGPAATDRKLAPTALLITSLRPAAPFILLNTAMGDQAAADARRCGCPLEQLGWTSHLRTIRSYEKLTAGGMTFLDTDVIRVLEEVLPARFGGGPADYQLVEDEDPDGTPRLRLLAHPRIGPLNEAEVADTFLTAIGGGSGARRVMELQWRQSGLLRVERRPPLVGASGKILHLHLAHRRATERV